MKKKIIYLLLALVVVGGVVALNFRQKIYGTSVVKDTELFIRHGATAEDVYKDLEPHVKSVKSLQWVAEKMAYKQPKSGRYLLSKGMSNREIIQKLRIGDQDPVTITFNNQDNIRKLAGRLAEQLEPDSITLLNSFTNPDFLAANQLSDKTILSRFIPNSYEVYWNTSADDIRDKMLKEYHKFWTKSRKTKAQDIGLTPQEVMTLASIVQKETAVVSERPKVAGLYLNRLRINMPLQADPTVIFALKQRYGDDLQVKRVLYKHLDINSPYNTYKHAGLPPALIAMPDVSAIDAVLTPDRHEYLYMCASTSKIGEHEFAKTLSQHNRNASKYSAWADRQGL